MKTKLPHVSFEVTSACNLNCRYCYNIWKMPEGKDFEHFNSFRKAKKTLKQLFKIADVKQIAFTGGEPLMAERFSELVLYTRMKGKAVSVISNGNYADADSYKQLIDLGVGLFQLPIHSPTATAHDYMTGVEGSWGKSIESTKTLLANGVKVVGVIVITKANFKHIAETLELMNKLGLSSIMLNRFNIGGKGIDEKENLIIPQKELTETYKIASETGRKFKMHLSSNVCTPICVLNPDDYKGIRFTSCSPDISKRPITIDIDGNLRFCNHSPTVLGNIFEKTLDDIFKSETTKLWSNIVPEFCSNCTVYDKCMAGCRAASEQMNLSLNAPDPIIEFAGYNKNKFIKNI